MPESDSEKIHKIVGELARIRDELRELAGEAGAAGGNALPGAARGAAAGAAGGGDPLDEILSAAPPPANGVQAMGQEADDAIVVDISLPPGGGGTKSYAGAAGGKAGAESEAGNEAGARGDELDARAESRRYPKKPPPRKHR